jgi:hypothetical protein
MRSSIGSMLAVALTACAAQQPEKTASLQNTVFVVGDQAAPMPAVAMPETKPSKDDKASDSRLRRLFWPLSGR